MPQDLAITEIGVPAEGMRIGALLKAAGLAPSTSEAMRKLGERAVRVDGDVVEARDLLLQAGRRASPAARQARIRARALDFRRLDRALLETASDNCGRSGAGDPSQKSFAEPLPKSDASR